MKLSDYWTDTGCRIAVLEMTDSHKTLGSYGCQRAIFNGLDQGELISLIKDNPYIRPSPKVETLEFFKYDFLFLILILNPQLHIKWAVLISMILILIFKCILFSTSTVQFKS